MGGLTLTSRASLTPPNRSSVLGSSTTGSGKGDVSNLRVKETLSKVKLDKNSEIVEQQLKKKFDQMYFNNYLFL